MRKFVHAIVLALAVGTLMPDVALCQEEDDFDDAPPPSTFHRPRRSWKSSPLLWSAIGVGSCIAIPYGLYQLYRGMKQCQVDQTRELEPWERAMAEAERNRPK